METSPPCGWHSINVPLHPLCLLFYACVSIIQEVTIGLLKDAMLSKSNATGFLIDGFPWQLDQDEMFEREARSDTLKDLITFTYILINTSCQLSGDIAECF